MRCVRVCVSVCAPTWDCGVLTCVYHAAAGRPCIDNDHPWCPMDIPSLHHVSKPRYWRPCSPRKPVHVAGSLVPAHSGSSHGRVTCRATYVRPGVAPPTCHVVALRHVFVGRTWAGPGQRPPVVGSLANGEGRCPCRCPCVVLSTTHTSVFVGCRGVMGGVTCVYSTRAALANSRTCLLLCHGSWYCTHAYAGQALRGKAGQNGVWFARLPRVPDVDVASPLALSMLRWHRVDNRCSKSNSSRTIAGDADG